MVIAYLRSFFRGLFANPLKSLREMVLTGRWAAADELGTQLLAADPANAQVMATLAYSLQQRGRLSEAAELAMKSARLDNSQWLPNFIAGVSLRGSGHEEQARTYLRRAWELQPNDEGTIREFLALEFEVGGFDSASRALALMPGRHSTKVRPVLSVPDWAQRISLDLHDVGDVESIPFATPKIWGRATVQENLSSRGNKPYVALLPGARIYSNCSFILTNDGYLLSDLAAHPQYGGMVSFEAQPPVWGFGGGEVLLDTSAYREQAIEGGIWLAGLASNAFGHWIPEFLPKLEFLMQHPDFAFLPIIVDEGMPPAHFDYLRRFTSNAIVVLPPDVCFVCQRLLVAPTPTFYPVHLKPNTIPQHEIGALSPRALRFLRASMDRETVPTASPQRRIFLGRRNMQWRRLLNEKEISEALHLMGFEYVYPEDLDLSQQIALFKSARWIVAPNGSALLNLIYAQPNTRILILTQPNLYNWGNFQGPMEALGYQPLFVCGEEASLRGKHADYRVKLQHILDALSKMGLDGVVG